MNSPRPVRQGPQFGAPAGLFLANTAVLFFSWYSGDKFVVWGWRIPFFLSAIMVAVGLWIRLGIMETPVFQRILDEERTERMLREINKNIPGQVHVTDLATAEAVKYANNAWHAAKIVFANEIGRHRIGRNFNITSIPLIR